MSREVYVFRDGELVPKHLAAPLTLAGRGPNVISDNLDGVWNPVDGKRYDSKSRYYAAVKASGGEIIGNEPMRDTRPQFSPQGVGQDVKRAIEGLKR